VSRGAPHPGRGETFTSRGEPPAARGDALGARSATLGKRGAPRGVENSPPAARGDEAVRRHSALLRGCAVARLRGCAVAKIFSKIFMRGAARFELRAVKMSSHCHQREKNFQSHHLPPRIAKTAATIPITASVAVAAQSPFSAAVTANSKMPPSQTASG